MWRPALAGPVAAVVLVVGACSRGAEPEQQRSVPSPIVDVDVDADVDVDVDVEAASPDRPPPYSPTPLDPPVPVPMPAQAAVEGDVAPSLELERLLGEVHRAWVRCSGDPQNCEPLSDLGHVYGGPLLDVVAAEIGVWSARRWAVRPPLDPGHDRLELLSAGPAPGDGGAAFEVRFCDVDGRILVEVAAGPDGGDVVIDETIASAVRVATVERHADGRLRIVARRTEERYDGGEGCDR